MTVVPGLGLRKYGTIGFTRGTSGDTHEEECREEVSTGTVSVERFGTPWGPRGLVCGRDQEHRGRF